MKDLTTSPEPVTVAPRRPWWLTLSAWTCWNVGIFLPVVPGVIVWVMTPLVVEVGWRHALASVDGCLLVLGLLFSSLTTIALMAAGWAFFRQRTRRGLWLLGLTLVGSVLSALPFLRGWMLSLAG